MLNLTMRQVHASKVVRHLVTWEAGSTETETETQKGSTVYCAACIFTYRIHNLYYNWCTLYISNTHDMTEVGSLGVL